MPTAGAIMRVLLLRAPVSAITLTPVTLCCKAVGHCSKGYSLHHTLPSHSLQLGTVSALSTAMPMSMHEAHTLGDAHASEMHFIA